MDPAEQTLSLRAIMSCSSVCSGGGVADACVRSGGVADASHPNGLWPATARMSCSSVCSGGGVADASHLNIMCAQVRVALPSISDVVNQVCPACVQRKNKPS